MLIRFYNVKIWTSEHGLIDGELWVENNRIRMVSQVSPLILLPWDREIDGRGGLLIPTFKNAHAHSPMTFLRSWADDMPLQEWLTCQVFPNEAKLTADDCYWLTKLAIAEYVCGGIGACADMYFHLPAIAAASAECGFRQTIMDGIVASDLQAGDGAVYDRLERRLQRGFDEIDGMGNGLVSYRIGLHAEYTNTEETMRAMARFAGERHLPVGTHLSETAREVRECRERCGVSPVRLLCDLGIFEYGGAAYHCVHVDDEDMRLLREHGVSVVSCPASNLKLAGGIAPLQKMADAGVRLALGTDGPASNNALDFFREMYLASVLQKGVSGHAEAMPAERVLDIATRGGAVAMGLTDCDGIRVGALADLTLIDFGRPNMQPLNDPIKNLIYAGGKDNVRMTVIDGKIVYEDGQWSIGEDIERIYERCNDIASRIRGV